MRLNILSDLHLGQGALERPETNAEVVILAGDIGRPQNAVQWARGFDKSVLYVPGNHEFYGGELGETLETLRELCRGTQVRLLDNDECVIGGVRFLGATLWTDFELFSEDSKRTLAVEQALAFMRDFSRIRTGPAPEALFTPAASAERFAVHAGWLEDRLAVPHDGPTVVVTHHAPSPRSIHPRFAGSPINACFVSNAEHLLDSSKVKLWVHGHTHDSFDYEVKGTRVVCNPRGYAKDGVNENARFDPCFVVDL